MPSKKQAIIDFLKQNRNIYYALVLIVLIPVFLFLHTKYIIDEFKESFDHELSTRATFIGETMDTFLDGIPINPSVTNQKLADFQELNPDVKDILIFRPNDGKFEVVAAIDPDDIGQITDDFGMTTSWERRESIAKRFVDNEGNRNVIGTSPIFDNSGNPIGLTSVLFSFASFDDTQDNIILRAYLIMFAVAIVVILLIMNQSRLFQYSVLYRKLQEVDQMKDEFISVASHELRTPVTAIRGNISLMLDGTFGEVPPKMRETLVSMQAVSDNLRVLIEDILEVSRIEQGRIEVTMAKTDLNHEVQEAVGTLDSLVKEKGLTLNMALSPDIPKLMLDKDRIRQIVVNIVGNSVKYTPKGSVTVTTQFGDSKDIVQFVVQDTGMGMSAKAQEGLFQKFYRVKTEDTRKITGTGLGLWITKRLIELMKGKIYLESIKGQGSKFTVEFPLAAPASSSTQGNEATPEPATAGKDSAQSPPSQPEK